MLVHINKKKHTMGSHFNIARYDSYIIFPSFITIVSAIESSILNNPSGSFGTWEYQNGGVCMDVQERRKMGNF